MAANANDLFMEVGDPGTATTLSAPGYTAGGTSITVASTTNWPTATGVIFAIDEAEVVDGEEVQIAGTYNEFEGVVASATSITSVDWVRGAGDTNYSAGALTRVYIPVSAERENRLVQGLVASVFDQDGTMKAGAVDNAAAIANDVVDSQHYVAGSIDTEHYADASVTNAKLATGTNEPGGAWDDWTPTLTNLSGGSLNYAKYIKIGNTVHFRLKYTLAGAGVSGIPRFSLPVTAASGYSANDSFDATGQLVDVNVATRYMPRLLFNSTTAADIYYQGGASGAIGTISSTSPFTWASPDIIEVSGTYEAA